MGEPRVEREPEEAQAGSKDTTIAHGGATPAGGLGSILHAPAGAVHFPYAFGRYRIERKLGQGGMGIVFLATDLSLERLVALKIPTVPLAENPSLRERFLREARLAATIQHPNICPVYDVGQHQGVDYLAMAHVEGQPLARFIRAGQKLPARNVATVVRCLALAMHEAHLKGVIHRDLKPGNIMIAVNKQPVIMDFGLARKVSSGESSMLTQAGAIMGTPEYMPPEQIDGDVTRIGPRSDVYALGVILYELLTGRQPFQGPLTQLIFQIASQAPTPVRKLRPDLDATIEDICNKALAKKPELRFKDMREFATALGDWLAGRVPESIAAQPNADEAEVVELFVEMAEQVAPSPTAPRKKTKPTPTPSGEPVRSNSLYFAESQPAATGTRKERIPRHVQPGKWLWLRVTLWTAIPPLIVIVVASLGWGGWTRFSRWSEERSLRMALEAMKKAPEDMTAVSKFDGMTERLKNHPAIALEAGQFHAFDRMDRERAEKALTFASESVKELFAASEYRSRGDAWWTTGSVTSGTARAKCFWHASDCYGEALRHSRGNDQSDARWRMVRQLPSDFARSGPSASHSFEALAGRSFEGDLAAQVTASSGAINQEWQLDISSEQGGTVTIKTKGMNHFVIEIDGSEHLMEGVWLGQSKPGNNQLSLAIHKGSLEVFNNSILLAWPVKIQNLSGPMHVAARFSNATAARNVQFKCWSPQHFTPLEERLAQLKE